MGASNIAEELNSRLAAARSVERHGSDDTFGVNGPDRRRILEELRGLERTSITLDDTAYDVEINRGAKGEPLSALGAQAIVTVRPVSETT